MPQKNSIRTLREKKRYLTKDVHLYWSLNQNVINTFDDTPNQCIIENVSSDEEKYLSPIDSNPKKEPYTIFHPPNQRRYKFRKVGHSQRSLFVDKSHPGGELMPKRRA